MSRRAQENIVAFIFLIFFVGMIILSFNYSPRARMVPVPIAITSAVIILIQIYLMNFRKDINLNVDPTELLTGGKSKESIEEGRAKDQVAEVKIQKIKGGKESVAILIVLSYLGLTLLIGILPAMLIFVMGFYIFITKLHWIKSLIITLLCEVGVWVLFVFILEVQFYEGWLVKLLLG